MKFIKIEEQATGNYTYVNPNHVTCIEKTDQGTVFWTSETATPMKVSMTPEELIQLLTNQD